ncbi:MAG: HDIG domain-containing protein [Bacteroidetes bacterium]|nr:HDIG domain-containing protein [Bacteroidota bacterium]
MNRIFSFIRDRHSLLYKGFLFIAALFIMVWFNPGQLHFHYDVEQVRGKKWTHDDLVSPYDFAVSKSNEETDAEQKEIRKKCIPYFRFDTTVAPATEQFFFRLLQDLNAGERKKVITALDEVYSNGIRAVADASGKTIRDKILVVKGNIAEEHRLLEYPDVAEADSIIAHRLGGKTLNIWKSKSENEINANIVFDSTLTNRSLAQQLANISDKRGVVNKDQVIVHRGELVTDNIFNKLVSYREEEKRQGENNWLAILAGRFFLVGFSLFILFRFIRLFRREILGNDSRLLFILLMVVLTVGMSYLPSVIDNLPLLALPFCILPVIMRAFFDTRIALFVHLITIFIISIFLPGDRFHFVFVQLLTGISVIFSIVNMKNRSQLFISVIVVLLSYSLLHFGLLTISEGHISAIDPADFINYSISAVLLLLGFPLIFIFEKLFGFVSDVTLMELADTNNPLLRELAEKAPGTFQHSIQVANLAEEAIRRVGGNTLLVRAGALYHDIGKGDLSVYFIENQATGVNPHDELTFEESASIIIGHVIRGIEKAKAAKLPDQVIDFIRTHHGTTNTAYFLTLFKKNNPADPVDEELFRYPGPIPYSKETAVLMMADAVEASSRSLRKYDGDSIDALIENIIDEQADLKQFDNSDITLKDITEIKKIFKRKLRSIYHVRVEYPK